MHLECRYAQDMHCAYHVCMFQLNTYIYIQYIHVLSDTYMICTCRFTDDGVLPVQTYKLMVYPSIQTNILVYTMSFKIHCGIYKHISIITSGRKGRKP